MTILITCAAAIAAGVVAGNGAVWFFNKMPGRWLCDYDQEPSEELLHPSQQRIKSTPWKYVFTGLFIVCGIKLGLADPLYAFPAVTAMWLLLEMAIADAKYMIVPDQLIMLLVVTGIGFIPHHNLGVMDCLWGALTGFGIMAVIALAGKLLFKQQAAGGGDIKLFAALGLACGTDGVLIIFILTALISGLHLLYLWAAKGLKLVSSRPMVPYIAVSSAIFMVIGREMSYNIMMHF